MINKTYPITEKLLENAHSLSLKLLEQLNKEANNFKNNANSDSIAEIAAHKKEIVSELNKFSKQLTQVLATEQLTMSASGVTEYFKKADDANLNPKKSIELWDKIVRLSNQSRTLNEKNGASINLLAQHTQRSLKILKGKSQQATTYGPDGSTYNEQFPQQLITI